MPSLSTIVAFAGASLLLLVIPGPAVLYIVNRSVSDGRTAGLAAAAGSALGNLMHALAAAAGLSAVIATSATAFATLKWLGASYLIWVGVRTLMRSPEAIDTSHDSVSPRRAFNQGVVVNVLNPKVALFFLALLPPFVPAGSPSKTVSFLLLGGWFVLQGTLFLLGLVVVSARLGRLGTKPPLRRALQALGGTLFLALALRLLKTDGAPA